MFIGAEVRLDIGFSAAQARLANLTSGGVLRHASDDAYRDLGTGLALIMHRIAQATIRVFTQQVGTAIPSPATSPEAARSRRLPEPPPWPDPETP